MPYIYFAMCFEIYSDLVVPQFRLGSASLYCEAIVAITETLTAHSTGALLPGLKKHSSTFGDN